MGTKEEVISVYLARETTNHLQSQGEAATEQALGGGSSSFIFFAVSSSWVPGSHLSALLCSSGEGMERVAVQTVIAFVWLV